jgi:hypothetical protein
MNPEESHSLTALRMLRERAARFCHEAGIDLPSALLEDGLPVAQGPAIDPYPGRSEATREEPSSSIHSLDALIEWWVATHPDRKGTGLFLTPPDVARALLIEASRDGWGPASVLDPSVGAGVFLLEAHKLFGPRVALHGIDRDPMAVASTRLALWMAGVERDPGILVERIRLADALVGWDAAGSEPPARWAGAHGADLVCGNPPFGNAIEKRTALSEGERKIMSSRFADVARGPYDRSVLFVRMAGDFLAPRGRVAMLVPRALLAARYARGLRGWSSREVPLARLLRFPHDAPCVDAAVAMVGWIAQREAMAEEIEVITDAHGASNTRADGRMSRKVPRELLQDSSWGALLDPLAVRIERVARLHPCLGESCIVRSGATVAEAYEIAREVEEGDHGWRLLTSGLLTRYGDLWGIRPARYLGRTFARPVLSREARSVRPIRRTLYDTPKVLVCGLSRVLRARADLDGDLAGTVGTFLVLPGDALAAAPRRLRRLTILLNSAWYSMVHRARRGAAALSGGNVPLGRQDIEEFPLPSGFLDCEVVPLLDRLDPLRDDLLVQRAILALAGYGEEDAREIIEAWSGLLRSTRPGR